MEEMNYLKFSCNSINLLIFKVQVLVPGELCNESRSIFFSVYEPVTLHCVFTLCYTRQRSWLRHYTTSRKVAVSNPEEVDFF
jgi:hypothetical protein